MKECNIDVLEVRQVNRIAELRKKIGLSQSALGEILGVSQQTISKYENLRLWGFIEAWIGIIGRPGWF